MRLLLLALSLSAAHAQLTETFLNVPGARLRCLDSRNPGTPVIFLHPATGNSDSWELQAPAFTAAGYRVIACDRRGWGATTTEPSAPPTPATDDLLAIADQLKLEKFHLIGSALGGFVAFDFAISHPDRLLSLVIANSIGGLEDPQLTDLGRRLRPPAFDALPPDLRELGPEYRAANPEGVRRWLAYEAKSRRTPNAPTPLRNHLTLKLLESITTRTLLLTGDADLYAPPTIQNTFARHLPNSRTTVIPGAGHSAFWEQPAAFNRTVLDFLAFPRP